MFEILGYFREYYIDNKFIGCLNIKKDREQIGYYGRKYEILEDDIFLDNKKKIKKGTKVNTIIYPLNGKIIK